MKRIFGIFKSQDQGLYEPYTAVPTETPVRGVLVLSRNPLEPKGVCAWVGFLSPLSSLDEKWLAERFGSRITNLDDVPPQVLVALARQNPDESAIRITFHLGRPDTVVGEDPNRGLVAAQPLVSGERFVGWAVRVFKDGQWATVDMGSGLPKGRLKNLAFEVQREWEQEREQKREKALEISITGLVV